MNFNKTSRHILEIIWGFILVLIASCTINEGTDSVDKNDGVNLWINNDYYECLNKNFNPPCECRKKLKTGSVDNVFFLINFEEKHVKLYNIAMERYPVHKNIKMVDDKIGVYETEDSTYNFFTKNKTLFLVSGHDTSMYIKKNDFLEFVDENIVLKFNASVFFEQLKMQKSYVNDFFHDKVFKNAENNDFFYKCNRTFGLSVLYEIGECENNWIVDKSKNEIKIFKWNNACMDPLSWEDDAVKKKFVFSFSPD